MNRTTRNWYYKQIHTDARTLNIYTKDCDAAYRNVLAALTGKRSCKDMTGPELVTVHTFMSREVYKRMPPVSDAAALAILNG